MSPADLDEIRLIDVARAAERDPDAAERLFSSLLPRVRNLVRYLVRGDSDVDDWSQDALVAVLQGLPTYRGEGSFVSWTDRIVARTVFAALKRRTQSPAAPRDPAQLGHLASQTGSGSDYVMRRQVVALLDQLPDEQRVTLVLRHVLGLSVRELATEVGAPEETVRSRLRLGKARLKSLLEAEPQVTPLPSPPIGEMLG